MTAPMTDAHPRLQAWRERMSARRRSPRWRLRWAAIWWSQGRKLPDFWRGSAHDQDLVPARFRRFAGFLEAGRRESCRPRGPSTISGWPGLGRQPHDPTVKGIDDLIAMVVSRMDRPVDLVAQSMGGVIAARVALAHPTLVRRLVLTVTSGGVDMASFGASDWRIEYRKTFPTPRNGSTRRARATAIARSSASRRRDLLIWGELDPISSRRRRTASREAVSQTPSCMSCPAVIMISPAPWPTKWRRSPPGT